MDSKISLDELQKFVIEEIEYLELEIDRLVKTMGVKTDCEDMKDELKSIVTLQKELKIAKDETKECTVEDLVSILDGIYYTRTIMAKFFLHAISHIATNAGYKVEHKKEAQYSQAYMGKIGLA